MKHLFLFLMLGLSQLLPAQQFSITGRLAGEDERPLAGATVALQHPWGEVFVVTKSESNGNFAFQAVGKGGYRVEISMVGYKNLRKEVTLSDRNIDMGTLRLEPDSLVLSGVVIKSTVPTAQQKGDTIEFNAAAFKVMKDANADELVEKLPSVTVENGTIKAQGENVGQVLVDGRQFFSNDPTAALKNLPAEVIDKIQIFDQQSEQAQFTGFSDGNTTKTINIVTKAGMRNGQFGKVYAGYGYDDKYQAGGNINFFDGDRRLSLIGLSNNINVQNFSSEDLLGAMGSGGNRARGGNRGGRRGNGNNEGRNAGGTGAASDFLVRPSGGIATTHALGLNYSDKWGKKWDVGASYFFNKSENISEQTTHRQFIANNEAAQVYDENNTGTTDNLNHRFNARVEWTPDSANAFVWRPRLSLQHNEGASSTFGQTALDGILLNQTDNTFYSDLRGVNFSNTLLWRHKFFKKGRTVSVDFRSGYAPKAGNSSLQSFDGYFTGQPQLDTLDQRSDLDVGSWNAGGNLEYTEPIGANSQLLFNYRLSYQQESSDKRTYDVTQPEPVLDEQLSNIFSNDYVTYQAGAGYLLSKDRDLNFNIRVNLQWAELSNDRTFPETGQFDQKFTNVLPSAMLRYNVDKQHNIRIIYRSSTQLPSIDQLQDVVNNANPLQLSVGNPNLKQSFQQNLFLRYQSANADKSTAFFGMVGGAYTLDNLSTATYLPGSDHPVFQEYGVLPGAQISRPVNLDGAWNLRSFVSWGRPVKPIKTNVNLDLSYNFARTPGLLDDARNFANSNTFGGGVTFASNISEKVDFTVSARPAWNKVRNTLPGGNNTEFISQNSRLKFNWVIAEGLVLRTDLTHTLYAGLSDDFNQNFWLWNLGIGKKLFKNERGEITLAVNDLLNQNRNIARNIAETYIEDVQTNALRQFVMLSFTYNLRNFSTGKPSSRNNQPEEERFGPAGRRRGGW